eukprot:5038466-Alexandrium_andersonii.AAC.1
MVKIKSHQTRESLAPGDSLEDWRGNHEADLAATQAARERAAGLSLCLSAYRLRLQQLIATVAAVQKMQAM